LFHAGKVCSVELIKYGFMPSDINPPRQKTILYLCLNHIKLHTTQKETPMMGLRAN
jgi:hypothetical protein